MKSSRNQPRRRRWWPAIVILVAAALCLLWIWGGEEWQLRQDRVVTTQSLLIGTAGLLLLWLMLVSGLTWKFRWRALLGVSLMVAGFVAAFRYEGVTGDLVPVFVPRWKTVETVVSAELLDDSVPRLDYPQFLGLARNGTVLGVKLARDWETQPPKQIWRRPVGTGWSGFAVAGDLAVTQEQHSSEERVVCYDLVTGNIRWSHADKARFTSSVGGIGPRATPTITAGRVYSMGATGILNAIDLQTGRVLWSRNVLEEADASVPDWGMSGSPLTLDKMVVVSVGGRKGRSLVSYDQLTGDPVWSGGTDRAGYASPFVATLAGRGQIIILNDGSVAGHDPRDGHVLWSHPWPDREPNVSQPVPLGDDRLIVSSGYGVGCKVFEVSPDATGQLSASLVWRSLRLKSKFANIILHEGSIYGIDDGILTCVDAASGRRRWKSGRYGHGQLIRVEELLLVSGERGDIVLVQLDPEQHRELTRFQAIDGKVWNPPALAGSLLLLRNHREAALVKLPTTTKGR